MPTNPAKTLKDNKGQENETSPDQEENICKSYM